MNKLPKTKLDYSMNKLPYIPPSEAKELLNEIESISYVIVRNDGIVQRSMLCDLCIYLDTEVDEALRIVNTLAVEVGSSYRFRKVLLKDLKR